MRGFIDKGVNKKRSVAPECEHNWRAREEQDCSDKKRKKGIDQRALFVSLFPFYRG